MKIVLASAALVTGLLGAAPSFAQGVYIGPNGVGVDSGFGYRHRDCDRDGYRDDRRHDRRDGYYEGRSVSRSYRHRNDYDDRY